MELFISAVAFAQGLRSDVLDRQLPMELIVSVLTFVLLMSLGLFVGGYIERRHLKLLDRRESGNAGFQVTQLKSFPGAVAGPTPPAMLCGEAVISSDYLKTFLGTVRKIFGGEIRSYQSLLDRARREALQRLVEQARAGGYNALCNVRFATTDISGSSKRSRRAVMVTILAYATAYHCELPRASR